MSLVEHDALAQAELLRRGQVTAGELLDAALLRCERVNGQVNAVVARLDERAREAARAPGEGPLAGVPFLLKDLAMVVAGEPTRSGSRYAADYRPKHETELVARHRRAGLVTFGKTATSELGILPTCEAAIYGASRNPWHPERSTGGSSGGAAAAVAAGIVPLAHASDGGGSIRIPASSCGVFGMKPTRGRVPLGPYVGDVMHGLVMEHAVSRTVRDSAALLDAVDGPDVGAPYAAPAKARPWLGEVAAPPGRLRIAFTAKPLAPLPVHPEAVAAVNDAAALCESLGHQVEEASWDVPEKDFLMQAFIGVWTGGVVGALEGMAHALKRPPTEAELEPLTWAMYQLGQKLTVPMYLRALYGLQGFARAFQARTDAYDVWLTPTAAEPPPPLGQFGPMSGDAMAGLYRAAPLAAFTSPLNVTGQPAMSVPLYWTPDGLPLGAQFFARFGDDAVLWRLAGQLEQARPWAKRRPQVWAG